MFLCKFDMRLIVDGGDYGFFLLFMGYDDDVLFVYSCSDQDIDSEDDELQMCVCNSWELCVYDRIVLMEEEEMD